MTDSSTLATKAVDVVSANDSKWSASSGHSNGGVIVNDSGSSSPLREGEESTSANRTDVEQMQQEFVRMKDEIKRMRSIVGDDAVLSEDLMSLPDKTKFGEDDGPQEKLKVIKQTWGKLECLRTNTEKALKEYLYLSLNEELEKLGTKRDQIWRDLRATPIDPTIPKIEAFARKLHSEDGSELARRIDDFRVACVALLDKNQAVDRLISGQYAPLQSQSGLHKLVQEIVEYAGPLESIKPLHPHFPSSWEDIIRANYQQATPCVRIYDWLHQHDMEKAQKVDLFSTSTIGNKILTAIEKVKKEQPDVEEKTE